MIIRAEKPSDIEKIWNINADAFETNAEANLVNSLREIGCTFISLVAEVDSQIVGHILFTPVELSGSTISIVGLAPMAVLNGYQNKGIGSELVKAGLARCESLGYDAVVVLGHPDFYPKFGFVPSVNFGIQSEYDVPAEVFMAMELTPGALDQYSGIIKYHQAFNGV